MFVAWNSGALAEGREVLQSAIACSPALPEPIMLMGMQVLLEDGYARTAGVVEEVKRHVASAVALLPDDPHVLLQAVIVLLDAEAIAEATIKLTELRDRASELEDAESTAALNFVVARVARLRGRTDLAETQLKVAIELDPAEPEHRVQLAELLVEEGRLLEAEIVIDSGLARAPQSKELLQLQRAVLAARSVGTSVNQVRTNRP